MGVRIVHSPKNSVQSLISEPQHLASHLREKMREQVDIIPA